MGPKLPREPEVRNVARRRAALDLVAEAVRQQPAGQSDGSADRPLEAGATWRLRLTGHSMRPLLRCGDQLLLRAMGEAPERRLKIGQIVLFEVQDQLVCHRVLRVRPLELAGDFNQRLDRIDPRALLGQIVAAERDGRRLRLDAGPLRAAGPALAVWHRLGRQLLLRGGLCKAAGVLLERSRISALRLLALGWRRAPASD